MDVCATIRLAHTTLNKFAQNTTVWQRSKSISEQLSQGHLLISVNSLKKSRPLCKIENLYDFCQHEQLLIGDVFRRILWSMKHSMSILIYCINNQEPTFLELAWPASLLKKVFFFFEDLNSTASNCSSSSPSSIPQESTPGSSIPSLAWLDDSINFMYLYSNLKKK